MLRNTKDLENYAIGATDGHIGHVKDFLFDDDLWVVRYLVVYTGSWLSGRRVLISPIALHDPDWDERTLPADVTREQVRNSPDVDTQRSVTRQHELEYLGYYGYPTYWGGTSMWDGGMYPYAMMPGYLGYGADDPVREREEAACRAAQRERRRNDDPHLRSCKAVDGYHVHATDGDIGHVCGFLVDEATWAVRALIVDTSDWWLGHKVLIAPRRVTLVSWADKAVSVALTREFIKNGPHYDVNAKWESEPELAVYLAGQLEDRPGKAIEPAL